MDDGLTVVYNADYVHDNLAVEIRPALDWLTVSPMFGTVPAGTAADLDITIDTTSLIGGDYSVSINLSTNDPANAYIQVPINMHLTGIPDIAVDPTALAFPTTFVGFDSSLSLTIQNVGTDVLTITDYSLTGDFAQSGLTVPVNVPVLGAIPVTVDFVPTTAGAHTGTLTLISDDPDEPSFVIDLSGDALIPPEIGATPDSITALVPLGESVTETLTIHNTGGSDLNWDGAPNIVSGVGSVTQYHGLELDKGEFDPRPGILGSGGPDLYGYTWKDSDEPGGPVFDWVDVSGVGTRIAEFGTYKDDGNVGPFPIGFTFNFYGNDFDTFRISTNGFVSFTSSATDYSNDPLPSSGGPENLLAVFWDDMVYDESDGSEIYYYYDGTKTVIQFNSIRRIAQFTAPFYWYQIILYPNGTVTYQYLTLGSSLSSHTIGIQNDTKDDGLNVVYNDASYIHENMAIEFSAGAEWMTLDPPSGTIAAGASQDVTVTLDASEIGVGIHEATIDLTSNDPYTPLYQVPVTIDVNARPVAVCADKVVSENGVDCTSSETVDDGSYDPDGGPLTYVEDPPAPYGLGAHTVTLTVTDDVGLSASCTATLTVVDTTPPALSVAMNPDVLWPPDGQLVDVFANVGATDACSEPDVVMTSCVSDEPENDPADDNGRGQSDIFGTEPGTPDWNMQLRAERSLTGDGRVYTATYAATDAAGNVSVVEGYAVVPLMYRAKIWDVELIPVPGLGTRISWGEVGIAVSYDVVRGDLSALHDTGDEIDLGTVVCIEANSSDGNTQGFEDAEIPAPGEVFFYVVEYDDTETSYYGTGSDGKPRSPAGGHCN
jgi:hypothetical protein